MNSWRAGPSNFASRASEPAGPRLQTRINDARRRAAKLRKLG
jgi:hypothetical protein